MSRLWIGGFLAIWLVSVVKGEIQASRVITELNGVDLEVDIDGEFRSNDQGRRKKKYLSDDVVFWLNCLFQKAVRRRISTGAVVSRQILVMRLLGLLT